MNGLKGKKKNMADLMKVIKGERKVTLKGKRDIKIQWTCSQDSFGSYPDAPTVSERRSD